MVWIDVGLMRMRAVGILMFGAVSTVTKQARGVYTYGVVR
jgi:hypothetical protein